MAACESARHLLSAVFPMDAWPAAIKPEVVPGAPAPCRQPRPRCTPATAPKLCALPSELAFWALWHCRHARPPDARIAC
ncbi:hypothetical protein MF4836_28790 [Pseudomonas sp. MF4836]|nr:hypothetical protein MF4836_28790 [Pseudomonas sp. MF4836]